VSDCPRMYCCMKLWNCKYDSATSVQRRDNGIRLAEEYEGLRASKWLLNCTNRTLLKKCTDEMK